MLSVLMSTRKQSGFLLYSTYFFFFAKPLANLSTIDCFLVIGHLLHTILSHGFSFWPLLHENVSEVLFNLVYKLCVLLPFQGAIDFLIIPGTEA